MMDDPKRRPRAMLTLYGAGVFVAAAAGLVVEIVAARLIAPYVGMSLYTWTAIIAVVLGGMAVGHWIGGRLAQMSGGEGIRRAGLAAAAAAASCAATPAMIRVVGNPVLTLDAPLLVLIALLVLLLFFVPSLLIAVLSPVLTKLAIDLAP
ncbi:MAG: fused MFS/spermidine synthase, partial [Alphaproteobacteria bacterium]|nr:fused MFS/spermidine synthase [Alphaproteobacteria bacterium]